jgi:hypothetical protein
MAVNWHSYTINGGNWGTTGGEVTILQKSGIFIK